MMKNRPESVKYNKFQDIFKELSKNNIILNDDSYSK